MRRSSKLKFFADLESCQTSEMELLAIVNTFEPSIIFAKTSIFDFRQGSEYVSVEPAKLLPTF